MPTHVSAGSQAPCIVNRLREGPAVGESDCERPRRRSHVVGLADGGGEANLIGGQRWLRRADGNRGSDRYVAGYPSDETRDSCRAAPSKNQPMNASHAPLNEPWKTNIAMPSAMNR